VAGGHRVRAPPPTRPGSACPKSHVVPRRAERLCDGAFKNSSLVAVSTGLLIIMSREESRRCSATITTSPMATCDPHAQPGVLNTFVFFLSRVVGFIVDKAVIPHRARHRAGLSTSR